METKAVTGDFMLRAMGSFTPDQIISIIQDIDNIFKDCDKILDKAKMPLTGYMSQMEKAVDVYEGMCSLNGYALTAYNEVYQQLDKPLMIGFANGATETLSQIVLDSITTENTFHMEEYYAVEVADSEIRYEKRVKWKLTLSDFMGIGWLEQGEGMPTLENVETVGIFANLFRWDYDIMGEPDQSLDEYLKDFIRSGEFNHKGYHPFKDFLSVLADVTIVVPIMESIMGWDFITGEDLTDFERGMKAIGAVIDLVTFGNGAMLMKAAEAGTLEFVGAIFKTMAVDAAGSGAAYLTGEMLEDLGLPPAAAMILTAIVSGTVTYSVGTYVFKNASGEVIESCSEAELKEILEGIDDIDISAIKGSAIEEVIEGSTDASLKNINEFVQGNKSFDDVLDDYAKVYAEKINSNRAWSWDDTILGGDNLSKKQRNIIKQQAVDAGLIPNIDVTKSEGMRYGFADFESAGVVKETKYLPENMWGMTDAEQFKWLNEQIGGAVEGYTWHHTEIPGKMQLVPTGIHNVTTHNGGRTAGMWADAPR